LRDGEIVGYVNSGAYGFTLGASVALGYVHCDCGVTKDCVESGNWEIESAGTRHAAGVSLRAFFDPKGERARG